MELKQNGTPQENYTILRIKRKRNEEPLDALVIESRTKRKKSKGFGDGMNVFQFAETVEEGAWEDEKAKRDLETRISTLARENAKKDVLPAADKPSEVIPSTPNQLATSESSQTVSPVPSSVSPRVPPRVDDPSRKYTIVPTPSGSLRPSESDEWAARRRTRLTAPPKVHSYKDLQRATFTMYDAVPSSTSLASMASPNPSAGGMDVDSEVAKFLPLLQDYLNIDGSPSALSPSPSANMSGSHEDDDYVWDVFYSRPASYSELYGSNGMAIGSVTGLPGEDGYGSSDESDYDDEDDEDSNAEDWYKNDYPDEEDDRSDDGGSEGSDVFHEHSDYDDVVHEPRGRWSLEDDDDKDF